MDKTDNFERFYSTPGPDGTEPIVSFDPTPVPLVSDVEATGYIPRIEAPIAEHPTQTIKAVTDVEPVTVPVTRADGSVWEIDTHPTTGKMIGSPRLIQQAPAVRMVYEDHGHSVSFSANVDRRRGPAAAHALHAAAQQLSGNRANAVPFMPVMPGMGVPAYSHPAAIPGMMPPYAAPVTETSRPNFEKPAPTSQSTTEADAQVTRKPQSAETTGTAARLVPKIVKRGIGIVMLTYAMDFIGYNAVSFVSHPTHLADITGNIRVSKNPFIGFEDMGKILG
ncbi:MAG TPA: hypothetical protein VFH39_01145 [Candidatus Saccharimonadales bacterium]|nr:hypothetical protein [Candidatus Saccharimonadales bacterium]